MTTEKKLTIGENLLKYWKYYGLVLALISAAGWIYSQGSSDNDVENRTFTTKELKYETEKYITQRPSPIQEQRAYILDSINKSSAIKSRAKRDSMFMEEVKARKLESNRRRITDSINKLNADQLYQIKQEFKEIQEILKRNNNQ